MFRRFEHEDSRRDGGVERIYLAAHRQGGDEVAFFAHEAAYALALRADDESDAAAVVEGGVIRAVHVRAEYPDAARFELVYGGGEVRDFYYGNIFNSTRRGLGDCVVEGHGVALRDNYPVNSGCLRASEDSAEVVRVFK